MLYKGYTLSEDVPEASLILTLRLHKLTLLIDVQQKVNSLLGLSRWNILSLAFHSVRSKTPPGG